MMPDWQIKSFVISHHKIGLKLQAQQQAPLVKPSDVFLVGVPGSGSIWLSHILHGLRSDGSSWVWKMPWRLEEEIYSRFLKCYVWDEGAQFGRSLTSFYTFGSFWIFVFLDLGVLWDLGVWDHYVLTFSAFDDPAL